MEVDGGRDVVEGSRIVDDDVLVGVPDGLVDDPVVIGVSVVDVKR